MEKLRRKLDCQARGRSTWIHLIVRFTFCLFLIFLSPNQWKLFGAKWIIWFQLWISAWLKTFVPCCQTFDSRQYSQGDSIWQKDSRDIFCFRSGVGFWWPHVHERRGWSKKEIFKLVQDQMDQYQISREKIRFWFFCRQNYLQTYSLVANCSLGHFW